MPTKTPGKALKTSERQIAAPLPPDSAANLTHDTPDEAHARPKANLRDAELSFIKISLTASIV
jgi:hypothetical protein